MASGKLVLWLSNMYLSSYCRYSLVSPIAHLLFSGSRIIFMQSYFAGWNVYVQNCTPFKSSGMSCFE